MDHGDYIKKSSNQNLFFSFSFQHTRCHFQLQAMFLPLMIGTPFEVMKKCCLMKNGLKIVKHLLEAWFTTHTIHPQKQMIILTRYQRKKSGLTNHCTLPIRFRSLRQDHVLQKESLVCCFHEDKMVIHHHCPHICRDKTSNLRDTSYIYLWYEKFGILGSPLLSQKTELKQQHITVNPENFTNFRA